MFLYTTREGVVLEELLLELVVSADLVKTKIVDSPCLTVMVDVV
jgi:hypothetical protein